MSSEEAGAEVLAEWKIRRIHQPPKEPIETHRERTERWVLHSLGVESPAQDMYVYLATRKEATLEELAEEFNLSEEEARDHLGQLYTIGLVSFLGKMYSVEEPLSRAIVNKLIPRLTEILKGIAKTEADVRARGFFR